MTSSSSPDLLSQREWLRAIALQLTRDQDLADDIAQDVCVATLSKQPRSPAAVRPWLQAMVLNRVRQHVRAWRVRQRRECHAAREELTPGVADTIVDAELQAQLQTAVLALAEPYRTTLLCRYFEGLPPRQIARRLGVPVATVKSQLHRGLELLRQDLRVEDPGVRRSLLALAAPWSTTRATTAAGASTTLGLALPLLATGLVALAAWPHLWPSEATAASSAGAPLAAAATGPLRATPAGTLPRETLPPIQPERARATPDALDARAARASADSPLAAARGRACDAQGRPLHGIAVRSGATTASTDAQGEFTLHLAPTGAHTFEAQHPDWVTVYEGRWTSDTESAPTVVLAPALQLAGRVTDARGGAIPGAQLRVLLPADLEARIPSSLTHSAVRGFTATTDASGAFQLQGAPRIEGATLQVSDGAGQVHIALPAASDRSMVLVMPRADPDDDVITGLVRNAAGEPVAAAWVAYGYTSTQTGPDGRFALSRRGAGAAATTLLAAAPGALPARCTQPGATVELVLGGPSLAIAGQVVDARGAAVEGALVWIDDPEHFGLTGPYPAYLEYILAGWSPPPGVLAAPRPEASLGQGHRERPTRCSRVGSLPDTLWGFVRSDARGRFTLHGLLPRSYTVRALDPARGGATSMPAVVAGSDAIAVHLAAVPDTQLRARLVTPSRQPLAGVLVSHRTFTRSVDVQLPTGNFHVERFVYTAMVRTDAEGRFAVRESSGALAELSFCHEQIMPLRVRLEAPAAHELEFVAQPRCEFRIALASHDEADAVSAADAAGRELELLTSLPEGGLALRKRVRLSSGRSGAIATGQDTTTVRLWRAGQLVRSVSVSLIPGRPQSIG